MAMSGRILLNVQISATGERSSRAGRLFLFMSVYGKLARKHGYVRAHIFKRVICKAPAIGERSSRAGRLFLFMSVYAS